MLCTFPWVPQQLCKGSLGYYRVNVRSEKSVLIMSFLFFNAQQKNELYNSPRLHYLCFRSSSYVFLFSVAFVAIKLIQSP
jgi:hypothetical protein